MAAGHKCERHHEPMLTDEGTTVANVSRDNARSALAMEPIEEVTDSEEDINIAQVLKIKGIKKKTKKKAKDDPQKTLERHAQFEAIRDHLSTFELLRDVGVK